MSAGIRLPGTPEPMYFWTGSDGIRIAGDSWGDPSGPLVMLLHGGGQTRHAWKGTGRLLGAAGYFVVALDTRGHGDSDWAPKGHYGPDAMVQDLKCVVAALGNRRPVLVGASQGGGTSLLAVADEQVDATALVLVDIAPRVELEGVKNIIGFMSQKPEGFVSLDEVAEAIGKYQPHRRRERNLEGLAKNVRLGADGKYRWHWDPLLFVVENPSDELSHFEGRQQRLEACALRLRLPTLLVRGRLSDLLSEAGAQAFLKLCPHSEYVNVAGAAHMVAGDRNDLFGNAVIEFLSRIVPVGGQPVHGPHQLSPDHVLPEGDFKDVP